MLDQSKRMGMPAWPGARQSANWRMRQDGTDVAHSQPAKVRHAIAALRQHFEGRA